MAFKAKIEITTLEEFKGLVENTTKKTENDVCPVCGSNYEGAPTSFITTAATGIQYECETKMCNNCYVSYVISSKEVL